MGKIHFPQFGQNDYSPFQMRQLVQALELRFQQLEQSSESLFDTTGGVDSSGEFAPIDHTHVEADITDLQHVTSIFELNDVSGTAAIGEALVWTGSAFEPSAVGGGVTLLNDLTDVNAFPTDGQVLKWNSATLRWIAADDEVGSGGSGGSDTLVDLLDTNLTGQQTYDILYNTVGNIWRHSGADFQWWGDSVRLGKSTTINWWDEASASIPMLEFAASTAGVTPDPDIGSVTFLAAFEEPNATAGNEVFTPDIDTNGVGNITWAITSGTQPTQVDAEISTTQAKYGTQSIYAKESAGAPAAAWSSASIPGSYFSFTGDFTIECDIYIVDGTSEIPICGSYVFNEYQWKWTLEGGNQRMGFIFGLTNTTTSSGLTQETWGGGTNGVPTGSWQHIAVCRQGDQWYAWLNGALSDGGANTNASAINIPTTTNFNIMAEGPALGAGQIEAYIDNLRITDGVARYTTAFTPPTGPHDDGSFVEETFVVGDPNFVTHFDGTRLEIENNIGVNWDDTAQTPVEFLVLQAAAPAGVTPDPNIGNVTFLLTAETGVVNSGSIPTDISDVGFTYTGGDPIAGSERGHISDTSAKHGTKSVYVKGETGATFTGLVGPAATSAEAAAAFGIFGTAASDEWTIEFWIDPSTEYTGLNPDGRWNNSCPIISTRNTQANQFFYFQIGDDGDIYLVLPNSTGTGGVSVFSQVDNGISGGNLQTTWMLQGWTHWAMCRESDGQIRAYCNGNLRARTGTGLVPTQATTVFGWITTGAETVNLGCHQRNGQVPDTQGYAAYIDDIRFTEGVARYTDGGAGIGSDVFTPPGPLDTGSQVEAFIVGDPNFATQIDGTTTTITGAAQLDTTLNVDGISTLNNDVTITTTLDDATGDEVALQLDYTTNKATSGADTGFQINMTDTLSPGTSLFADYQLGGVSIYDWGIDGTYRIYDLTGADSAAFSHDGTDFNTVFTGTTDWNITGLTGHTNFPSGSRVHILADINTATPPTTEAVTATLRFYDADLTDNLGEIGYGGNNQLRIDNNMRGGGVHLRGVDDGGTLRNLIYADPGNVTTLYNPTGTEQRLRIESGGAVTLRSDGNTDAENRVFNLAHQDGTLRAYFGHTGATQLNIGNVIHGGPLNLFTEDAGGTARTAFYFNPAGGSLFYHGTGQIGSSLPGGLNVNRIADAETELRIGEITTLRGNSQDAVLTLYGEEASAIYGAAIRVGGANLIFQGAGGNPISNIQSQMDIEMRSGRQLQFNDSTNLDTGVFSHDGTDFNTVFTNTTDWNITGANLVVGGDLTVSGTTTTINSNVVSIADNIILLNSDATDPPTENAGLEVYRGGVVNNPFFLWNETNDSWEFVNPAGETIGDFRGTGTSRQLLMPSINNQAAPTISFGDGDTGWFEIADDFMAASIAGTYRFAFSGNNFQAADANGPALINVDSTTGPTLLPNRADSNTGVSWDAADELSLRVGNNPWFQLRNSGNHTWTSVLQAATGNETAYALNYTVNKLTSGDDTGLRLAVTETSSPGTSLFAEFVAGGVTKFSWSTNPAFTIYDNTGADSAVFSHDGANFNTDFTGTTVWDIRGQSVVSLREASQFRLYDGPDTAYMRVENFGTYIQWQHAGQTDSWFITDLIQLWLRDGATLRISDSTDLDYAEFSHDGTDFNTAFTNTTDWNITGLTGFMSIDADDFRMLGNLATATPPTTEAVNFSMWWYDSDGTDPLARIGFQGSSQFRIQNMMHGQSIELRTEDSTGTAQTVFAGNGDNVAGLYYQGRVVMRTTPSGIETRTNIGSLDTDSSYVSFNRENGTLKGQVGIVGGDGWLRLNNAQDGYGVEINADDALNVNQNLFVGDPDGSVDLYFDGTATARTLAAASGGLEANNTLTGAGFERVLTASDIGGGGSIPAGTTTDSLLRWSGSAWVETTLLQINDPAGNHSLTSVLDEATGNEVALALNYTTNKLTSGNDTGFQINMTDTASPGTSLLAEWNVGGVTKFSWSANPTFTMYDNTGLDSAAFNHDGTDFNTAFTNTTDWNITGLSGSFNLGPDATQPWLTLDAVSTGDNWDDQGAGISIGEAGAKNSGFHLTYNNGVCRIGSGSVDDTTTTGGTPSQGHIDFSTVGDTIRMYGGVEVRDGPTNGYFRIYGPAGTNYVTMDHDNATLSSAFTNTREWAISGLSLDDATGNETAMSLAYTVNKATSGDDTGFLINKTDTLSQGTSRLIDVQVGGVTQFNVQDDGVTNLGNFSFDTDQTVGVGQDNYVLTYDDGTGLISLEAAAGGPADGTVTNSVLRWSGTDWVEEERIRVSDTGSLTIYDSTLVDSVSFNHDGLTLNVTASLNTPYIDFQDFTNVYISDASLQVTRTTPSLGFSFGTTTTGTDRAQFLIVGDLMELSGGDWNFSSSGNQHEWLFGSTGSSKTTADEYAYFGTDNTAVKFGLRGRSGGTTPYVLDMRIEQTVATTGERGWRWKDGSSQFMVFSARDRLIDIQAGTTFRIRNSLNADYADFSHDGTDFNTDFTNTSDWNVTNLAGFNVGNYSFDVDQTVGAGQDNYVLTYDNGTGLISLEAAGGGGITGTVADNEIVTGTGASTVDSSSNFTYNGTTVSITSGLVPSTPSLELNTNRPVLVFDEADAAADNGRWYLHAEGEQFALVAINDANSASNQVFTVDRTGTTVDSLNLQTKLAITGNQSISGTLEFTTTSGEIFNTADYLVINCGNGNVSGLRMEYGTPGAASLAGYFYGDANGMYILNNNGQNALLNPVSTQDIRIFGTTQSDDPVYIGEQSAASADSAGYGQFWVLNDSPNRAMFTDDGGNDFCLNQVNRQFSTAATTVTSSITLVSPTGISGLSLKSNTRYRIQFVGFVQSNTTGTNPGFRLRGDYTGTVTSSEGRAMEWVNAGLTRSIRMLPDTTITGFSCGGNADETLVQWEAFLLTGTAGTFTMQFAQSTSNATSSVLSAGAYLAVTEEI